jgi:glycosyltransferase involved in cell wall biosynthesis
MTRVVYWNNIPSPYMVERFNALAMRGNIDIEAWFSARTEPDRTWRVAEETWEFPYRYLPRLKIGRIGWSIPMGLARRGLPDLFVSLHSRPDFLAGWMLARLRHRRTAFWVLPTYDSWVRRRNWKEWVKRQIFPRADAILTCGEDGRSFVKRYGAHDERIFFVPQVIDVDHFARARSMPSRDRERVRKNLGLRGVTFVYVGRLWAGKGVKTLIDAFAKLRDESIGDMEATLLLVGDGVDEEWLRRYAGETAEGRVVFAGFRDWDELPEVYGASDVFVFPTLGDPYGLVVDEAMAAGLPVISTTAAGEIRQRIRPGENGFLVEPGRPGDLAAPMLTLARDPDLRRRLGIAAAADVAGKTPELWAEAFEQATAKILSMPPVRVNRSRRRLRARGTTGSTIR